MDGGRVGLGSGGEILAGFARDILDTLDALVLVRDPEGRIVEVNRAAERLAGRRRDEMLGRLAWELVEPPASWERSAQDFRTIVRAAAFPVAHEADVATAGGETVTVRWSSAAITDGAGNVRFLVSTGVEVTELRRATRAQREQLRFLQTLIDTIPNPIFYKGVDGRYLGCNRAFAEMMGLPREAIVGRSVYETSPPELAARYEAADAELFRSGGVQTYESRVQFADGSVHDVIFFKATWSDTAGQMQGLVGVVLDITARKRAEHALAGAHAELEARVRARTAELEALKEKAEAADRAKGEFLNIASHELRTPLTALRVTLQRARRELQRGEPIDSASLVRMERYANRLVRLVGDLVEASRLERGLLVVEPARCDLRELIVAAVEDARSLAPGRRIDLDLPASPLAVDLDADRIAQVLANLIDNAVKYAPPESPVEMTAWTDAGEAVVCVSDRGPGIPATSQERLFTRFYRLPSAMHQPGLGLGLNISREIVQRHGGSLIYETREGGGSRFVVRLPLAPAAR